MASSTSLSDDEAPENFVVSTCSSNSSSSTSTNFDDDDNDDRNCLWRCSICINNRRKFFCSVCIKSVFGFDDKQRKYAKLQANLKDLNDSYVRKISPRRKLEDVEYCIKEKKTRIDRLKTLIKGKKDLVSARTKHRDNLMKDNAEKKKDKLPVYQSNVKQMEDRVSDKCVHNQIIRNDYLKLLEKLKETAFNDIRQLIDYIFPIKEIVLKPDHCQEKISAQILNPTTAALADARNTSYIGGKWVLRESGICEMQYQIVAPSLPANGDYAAYVNWLAESKDDVPKSSPNEIFPSRVAAFRIVGALTYTAQLVNVLSFYLNVHLPHKIAYADFCKKLTEDYFERKVFRLNSDILYLAYTQGVNLSKCKEKNTLENILTLLNPDICNLGYFKANDVTNAPLMDSMESILFGVETESESEDENSMRLDWEAISSTSNEQEIEAAISIAPSSPNNQQTSIASGIINTATSFWRGSFFKLK